MIQVHPPTGVTHAISAFITEPSPAALSSLYTDEEGGKSREVLPDLVVVRGGNLLEIYVPRQLEAPGKEKTTRLQLIYQRKLYGIIESIAALPGRVGRYGHDAILITFRDAKLSVLQWDLTSHSLTPSSLHYFEGDESLKAGRESFPRPPIVRTDPSGRCATVIMFRHQMAVLPAFESESVALGMTDMMDVAKENEGPLTAAVGNSYVDNLRKIGIRDVRDSNFLYGAAEPTLLILHEAEVPSNKSDRTKSYMKKDICQLSALSLNLFAKRHPCIWHVSEVPSDAQKIAAVPLGGVLVITSTSLLYYNQEGMQTGTVLNTIAIPSDAAPPPVGFDLSKETPGEAAARYAREHGTKLHPNMASSALKFCDITLADWNLDLSGACVTWLQQEAENVAAARNPSLGLLGLRSGQLLLLRVYRRGDRLTLNVFRAGAGPPVSSLTTVGRSAVFVGSTAGDSLLVGYSLLQDSNGRSVQERTDQDQSSVERQKRRRLESTEDDVRPDAARSGVAVGEAIPRLRGESFVMDERTTAMDDDDDDAEYDDDEEDPEALLYGDVELASDASERLVCSMKVLDSLIGLGPLHSMVPWVQNVSGLYDRASAMPCLIACSGEGRSGSFVVLHQTVSPDVITEIPLSGVLGVWAVAKDRSHMSFDNAESVALDPDGEENNAYHTFLLISRSDGTQVLDARENMRDVTDELEFAGDVTTIGAGTLLHGSFMLQAFPQGLRLLHSNGELCHDLMVSAMDLKTFTQSESSRPQLHIASAHFSPNHVLVRLNDGSVRLVKATIDASSKPELAVEGSLCGHHLENQRKVTACCMFFDECGWLQQQMIQTSKDSTDTGESNLNDIIFCVVAYDDGGLAIWHLNDFGDDAMPEWQSSRRVYEGPLVISHCDAVDLKTESVSETPYITEMRMESFQGSRRYSSHASADSSQTFPLCPQPVLVMMTSDHCMYVYSAFSSMGKNPGGGPKCLKFRKLVLGLPALVPPSEFSRVSEAIQVPRLTRFDALGEHVPHSGICVTGRMSVWLVAARGTLWAHRRRSLVDRHVVGFTPFHNPNCPHGFIEVLEGSSGSLSISGLPWRQRLDTYMARQKIPIRATPVKACMYPEARLVAAITAVQRPYRPFLPAEPGGEPQASYAYALADAVASMKGIECRYELRLVRPGFWDSIWTYTLLPGESGCCVEAVHLHDATSGSTVPLIAVGTGFAAAGEDFPCSGRVLLFEVTRSPSESEGGKPWQGKLVYAREFKGPVTGLSSLEGNLLLSTGNRLETCILISSTNQSERMSNEVDASADIRTSYRLQRSAFYDGQTLVSSLGVVKNFVLMGDVQHGLQFVRYKEDGKQLKMLSKDFGDVAVRSAQFLISGPSLHFAASDFACNLLVFTYAPGDASSWKGQKLKQWGGFHVGDGIGAMVSFRMPQLDLSDTVVRSGILCGTNGGGLYALLPLVVDDKLFRSKFSDETRHMIGESSLESTLKLLQRELTVGIVHVAGLNPGAFRRRYAKSPRGLEGPRAFGAPLSLGAQGVLDGDLLMEFCNLPRDQQELLAAKAGAHWYALLRLLEYLKESSYMF